MSLHGFFSISALLGNRHSFQFLSDRGPCPFQSSIQPFLKGSTQAHETWVYHSPPSSPHSGHTQQLQGDCYHPLVKACSTQEGQTFKVTLYYIANLEVRVSLGYMRPLFTPSMPSSALSSASPTPVYFSFSFPFLPSPPYTLLFSVLLTFPSPP